MKHISENDRNFRTILAKCEGILSQYLKVIFIIATAYSNKSLRTLCLFQLWGCLAGLSSLQPAPAKPEVFVLKDCRSFRLGLPQRNVGMAHSHQEQENYPYSVFLVVTLESNPKKVRHFTDLQETEIDSLYSIRSSCSFSCQCWIAPHSKLRSASFSLNSKQLILTGLSPFPKRKYKIFLPSSIKCGRPLFKSNLHPALLQHREVCIIIPSLSFPRY